MTGLVVLIVTVMSEYLVHAILVGALVAVLRLRTGWPQFGWRLLAIVFAAFAVEDSYFLPALWSLDATITIRNPVIAQWLGSNGTLSLTDAVDWGRFDLLIWAAQAIIALWCAERLSVCSPSHSTSGTGPHQVLEPTGNLTR